MGNNINLISCDSSRRFGVEIELNAFDLRSRPSGHEFGNLPEGIGYIFIGTCQAAKSKNVDYAKSRKYGVPVSNNNWETDGKLAKIFYSSYASKYKFAFRECWSFTACRNFKRMVAKTYPENWTMYVQIDSNKKMRDMYTTITMKSKILREQAVKLKTYNEFDL